MNTTRSKRPGRRNAGSMAHGTSVARLVTKGRCLGLDGNAALTLKIHRVENLRFHFALGQTTAQLNDAISQCRFTVIDMGDDGKIADILHAAWPMYKSKVQKGAR